MAVEPVHLTMPHILVNAAITSAKQRYSPSRSTHADDMRDKDWLYEKIGAMTEFGFCWWANAPPPRQNISGKGDGGIDTILHDGRRVQIKGTSRPDLNLLVPCRGYGDIRGCDVLVMGGVPKGVLPEEGVVDLVGWLTADEFYEHAELTADRFARKMYRVYRRFLNPMRELVENHND